MPRKNLLHISCLRLARVLILAAHALSDADVLLPVCPFICCLTCMSRSHDVYHDVHCNSLLLFLIVSIQRGDHLLSKPTRKQLNMSYSTSVALFVVAEMLRE